MFTITGRQFLSGPNIHTGQSVLLIDMRFDGAPDRLLSPLRAKAGGLETMESLQGGPEVAGLLRSAIAALAPGATSVDLLLEIAARLQERFVILGGTGNVISQSGQDLRALLPAEDEETGVGAWNLASRMALALHDEADPAARVCADLVERYRQYTRFARGRALDQLTIAIARTATRLDIPVYRPDPGSRNIQLGQGRLGRIAFETLVEPVSHFAVIQSRDKWSTLNRLRQLGLPALPSALVTNEEAAVSAAAQIGHAVAVKPAGGGKGRGVSLELVSADQVRKAYRLAAQDGPRVLVERFAPGGDHRLLVVGGRMIAAARRIPAQVTGDGHSSIAQLIDALNADPARGAPYEKLLETIQVDTRMQDVLASQSMTLHSVPPSGVDVKLSLAGNISQGGTAVDVTAIVHPDNRDAVERTARAVGLNVVGVDFITPDIARSWRDVGGWVLEVNAPPGLRPHWIANPGQDVVTPIVRQMFPEGVSARIPTAGVTGSLGKTTTCQMVAAIAEAAGKTPGLATTQGIWSGRFSVAQGDSSGGKAALRLLGDPMINLGVFELARGALVKKGMRIDGVDVAAVLNLHDNHVGLDGISTREQMAAVKSVIVKSARRWVFLNAEDPLVLDMRSLVTSARLGLVSLDPANPAVAAHREAGHCIVTLEGAGESESLCLVDGKKMVLKLPLSRIPAAQPGRSRAIAANALFAAGIGYALGLTAAAIEQGLSGFVSDVAQNPGRHNRIEGLPFEVILNYGDGVHALADLTATLKADPPAGLRHLFLVVPGDRSDDWAREQGQFTAGHFDSFFLADLPDLRGRTPGEVPALVAQGLRCGGVADSAITIFSEQDRPVLAALETMKPGDRIYIINYDAERSLAAIEHYKQLRSSVV